MLAFAPMRLGDPLPAVPTILPDGHLPHYPINAEQKCSSGTPGRFEVRDGVTLLVKVPTYTARRRIPRHRPPNKKYDLKARLLAVYGVWVP